MNYTDEQLKLALAKMLPEQIYWAETIQVLCRRPSPGPAVFHTELLHLCWLAWKSLTASEQMQFAEVLAHETEIVDWGYYPGEAAIDWIATGELANASWQNRTIALATIKKIKIV